MSTKSFASDNYAGIHPDILQAISQANLDHAPAYGGDTITQKNQANAVFAIIPKKYVAALQEKFYFYFWNEEISEVRIMASFDTTEAEIDAFCAHARAIIS